MKRIPVVSLLILSIFSTLCIAQQEESDKNTFSTTFSREDYLADIDQLAKLLVENHPQPFEFTSKVEFWENVEEKKSLVTDSTTYPEFLWHIGSIIAVIGCGHTSMGYFNQEDKVLPVDRRFPVEARFIGSRLFVIDPLVNGKMVSGGDEIFSINGRLVEELRSDIFSHISSDGHNEAFPKELLNGFFTSYVPYALGFPDRFEIVTKGRKDPLVLSQLKEFKYKPRVNPKSDCQERLCFKVVEKKKLARMTIRSFGFYGDRFPEFRSFIDSAFKEIATNKIEHLIIDLRLNGGGSSEAGLYLLERIADRPFTYFAEASAGEGSTKIETKPSPERFGGETYILIDGNGTSTTGHFLSLAKTNKFATLIGEEAGATYTVNDNSKWHSLSKTGIRVKIARNTFFTTAKGLPKDRGVLPDHPISPNLTDFTQGTDTVLAYTLDLIGENVAKKKVD